MMIDPKEHNRKKSREDEIDAEIDDKNSKDPNLMDGFKTGAEKQRKYHDKPSDEQMYGGFREDEEQHDAPDHQEKDGGEDL